MSLSSRFRARLSPRRVRARRRGVVAALGRASAPGVVLGSVAAFVLLVGASIAAYPGGTVFDRRAAGHDLLRNFLCDLLAPVALNGQPNPVGAIAAPLGMLALTLGLGVLWWILPRAFASQPALGRAVRVAGSIATVGLLAVPLTPSIHFPVLHAVAVLVACAPALVAGVLATVGLARAGRARLASLGGALFAVGGLDAAIFAVHCAAGGPAPLALPALQRIACALLLAWVVALALHLRGRPGISSPACPLASSSAPASPSPLRSR